MPPNHSWNVAPSIDESSAHFGFYEHEPDRTQKAYCMVDGLSFGPTAGSRRVFAVGDEVQDILPSDVLAACLRDGRASYIKPEAE